MQLYLSSHRFGDSLPELLAMAGEGARTAVISNALDFIPPDAREAYARTVFDPVAEFISHGLDAFDLDLRDYFGRPQALAEELANVRLVFAVGGNAFLLRRAMRQSGFDSVAPPLIEAERLIYAGWSAGAVVAARDLRGIELMDDPTVLVGGYDPPVVWEGLGLIDVAIVPHFGSDHPEAAAANDLAAYLEAQGAPHRTLRDGEVLVMNGGALELRAATA